MYKKQTKKQPYVVELNLSIAKESVVAVVYLYLWIFELYDNVFQRLYNWKYNQKSENR